MIIYVYYLHVSESQFVRIMELKLSSQTIEQMVDRIMEYPERTKMQVLAPIVSGRKGTHVKLLEDMKKQGLCTCSSRWGNASI